jgi:hypothetical protein
VISIRSTVFPRTTRFSGRTTTTAGGKADINGRHIVVERGHYSADKSQKAPYSSYMPDRLRFPWTGLAFERICLHHAGHIAEMEKKIRAFPNPKKYSIEKVLIASSGASVELLAEGYFNAILTIDDLFGK